MRWPSNARLGKTVARGLLHGAGALEAFRCWNRDKFRILMYHNFPRTMPGMKESLARQCAHIARHYHPVTLTDIGRHLREGAPLPPHAVAVTVDDGYRDFLNAYPVFHAHGIPVTVFLVSGFLDRELWLWWDQIAWAMENSRRNALQVEAFPGRPPLHYKLETPEQRALALQELTRVMKRLSNADRLGLLESLPRMLDVEMPRQAPRAYAPLDWNDVRTLGNDSVDFGAHTITHPVLSRIQDPEEVRREIAASKERIEKAIRRPVLHFSYPNGFNEDFNADTLDVLTRSEFHTAVTTESGLETSGEVLPFRIKRISVEPWMPEPYFKELLAGLH